MISTGRDVRMLNDVVAVRFTVRYLYKDFVVKRDGRWQIVKSELTKPKPL